MSAQLSGAVDERSNVLAAGSAVLLRPFETSSPARNAPRRKTSDDLTGTRSADAPSWGQLVGFLIAFFTLQLVTSGTEEIGWRGYLTEKLLPGRGFWDAGWLVGVVWAVWHLPVATMIFLQQGMVHLQIAGSLVGFAMGIVAMAILQAWFYERTRSVFLNMVIHAAFNTLPLTLVLLWEGSPAAVLTNLLLWAVVITSRPEVSAQPGPRQPDSTGATVDRGCLRAVQMARSWRRPMSPIMGPGERWLCRCRFSRVLLGWLRWWGQPGGDRGDAREHRHDRGCPGPRRGSRSRRRGRRG